MAVKQKLFVFHVGFYTFASLIVQAITVVVSILSRLFLGPFQMGIWAFIQVLLTYSDYVSLGTNNAIAREIPFYLGAKNYKKARELKDIVFSFCLCMSFFVGLGFIVFAFIRKDFLPQELFYGLLLTAVLVMLQRVNNLFIEILRSFRKFSLLSQQMILSALVNSVLVIILAYQFKIYGFVIAMCLSLAFNVVYLSLKGKLRFQFRINWKELRHLISYGTPLMLIGVMNSVLLTFDRLVITRFLGFDALGLYTIAIMACTYVYSIPNAMGIVIMPNIQERYGAAQDEHVLLGYAAKWARIYRDLMPVLIGLAWILTPFLIRMVLPKFEGGIGAMKYLVLSVYFISIYSPYEHFLIAAKRQWIIFPILLTSFLIIAGLSFLVIKNGLGIEGMGLSMTVMTFFQFTFIYLLVGYVIKKSEKFWQSYFVIILNFAFLLFLLMLIDFWISFSNPWVEAFVQSLCFLLGCSLFVYRLNHEYNLLKLFQNKFLKRE